MPTSFQRSHYPQRLRRPSLLRLLLLLFLLLSRVNFVAQFDNRTDDTSVRFYISLEYLQQKFTAYALLHALFTACFSPKRDESHISARISRSLFLIARGNSRDPERSRDIQICTRDEASDDKTGDTLDLHASEPVIQPVTQRQWRQRLATWRGARCDSV